MKMVNMVNSTCRHEAPRIRRFRSSCSGSAQTDDLRNLERVTIERVLHETSWNKAKLPVVSD